MRCLNGIFASGETMRRWRRAARRSAEEGAAEEEAGDVCAVAVSLEAM